MFWISCHLELIWWIQLLLQTCTAHRVQRQSRMYTCTREFANARFPHNATSAGQMRWHGVWDTTVQMMIQREKKKSSKTENSIISQSEHIKRREHTLCHAPVSVNRHASGAPFSFSLTPSMQTSPLFNLPILGSPWQQDHTMQKTLIRVWRLYQGFCTQGLTMQYMHSAA